MLSLVSMLKPWMPVIESKSIPSESSSVKPLDELRCVVCGLCVEACPCDAIRMDTGVHAPAVDFRGDSILGKIDLLKRGTQSKAVQGGIGPDWRTRQPTVKQYDPPK